MAPTQPAPVPTYPNTSQLYDPLVNDRPKPDWQQAIYSNLATQQLMPEQQAVQSFAPPQQPQYAPPAVAPSPQATYAAIADATNAPMGDIVVDGYGAQSGGSAKKMALILLIILLLLGFIGGIGALMYKMGYSKGAGSMSVVSTTEEEQQGMSDFEEEAPTDEAPELDFDLLSPQYTDELVSGEVGEQLIASDGLVLMVHNVTRNYQAEDRSATSGEGERIKVDILVGNADETNSKTITSSMFEVITADGEPIAPLSNSSTDETSLDLSSGKQAEISLQYLIPEGTGDIALSRAQGYRVDGVIYTTILQVLLVAEDSANDVETYVQ